ncbi:hypothetical protein GPUN_0097 [Glaciecola punicea ACAM 611]|uniref:Uncharacterized protein n=1 Tax=Glaciecola punicea ACAM 611 TaxID=1121923 RepID=H5T7H4_9ALTE|nr:hypothetical protein GPUN_0097 [Glaciecola punicea ACAM 611]
MEYVLPQIDACNCGLGPSCLFTYKSRKIKVQKAEINDI